MLFQDLRYAVRQFGSNLQFAVVSAMSIALGIGASTAIFAAIYSVLLEPFPYAGAERMVHLTIIDKAGDLSFLQLTGPQMLEVDRAGLFEDILAREYGDMSLTQSQTPESIRYWALSANAFRFFGVPALTGRGFNESDASFGQEPDHVIVLGFRFWQSHYGGRRNVVGQNLELNHTNYAVIGVAPKNFWSISDVYMPLRLDSSPTRTFLVDAKLRPGITRTVAEAKFQSLLEHFAQETPDHFPARFKANLPTWIEMAVGSLSDRLFLLFGAVSLLLFIGCGNAGILLLARGVSRQTEISMRFALGATRARILRQLMTESLLLSTIALPPGIVFSYVGIAIVHRCLPPGLLPSSTEITLNPQALLYACVVSVVATLLFGLFPAVANSRSHVSLTGNVTRTSTAKGRRRVHQALIAIQVATSVLLLAGAGTAFRTLWNLYHSRLRYDPKNILIAGVSVDKNRFADWQSRVNYFNQLKTSVSQLHGIKSVALTYLPLPPVTNWESKFHIQSNGSSEGQQQLALEMVSPEFFQTLGIPLLEGRIWSDSESSHGADVALLNETMARRFGKLSAMGQRITIDNLEPANAYQMDVDDPLYGPNKTGSVQVIGVVADTPNNGLRQPAVPAVYVPFSLAVPKFLQLAIKTSSPPLANVRAVQQQIASINANQSINEITTAEEKLDLEGWAEERLVAIILGVLASLALSICAVGLYSTIAYSVSQRRTEFGIRLALGASKLTLIWTVVFSMFVAVLAGAVIGIASSALLGSAISKWTGVSVSDPAVLAGVIALMTITGTGAAVLPARRAASVMPMQSLRTE